MKDKYFDKFLERAKKAKEQYGVEFHVTERGGIKVHSTKVPQLKIEDNYEPSELYWHEALDRSHVACDHFDEYVSNHPAVRNDVELREEAEKVTDAMQEFYQLVASKVEE